MWTGYSFDSGGPFSPLQTFNLLLIGLRYERHLVQSESLRLAYTVDAIPLAIIPNNIRSNASFDPSRGWTVRGNAPRRATWGAGMMPLGLRVVAQPAKRVQPFVGAAAGGIYFTNPMPAANGRRFNFSAEAGAGAHVVLQDSWGMEVGFKLHHLSNAGAGEVNPGLDSKVFYVGFTTSR